jgi:hypothetical protein
MDTVIAFRLVGRFNCTREMLPTSSMTSSIVDDPLVNLLQIEFQGGFRRPRQSVKLSCVFLSLLLTAIVPKILIIILNGTIAAGMVVLLYRWLKARLSTRCDDELDSLDVCRVDPNSR